MKKTIHLIVAVFLSTLSRAQISYDSITISRFAEWYVPNWPGLDSASITYKNYGAYLRDERTIWIKPGIADTVLPAILQLTKEIQQNGEGAINRCFSPRHSVNYYRQGRVVLYLLVCFQCDGLLFSDKVRLNFLVSREARLKQMEELRVIFKDIR